MKASIVFIFLSVVGVAEALVHAWQENAFTTYWSNVQFSPYASLVGVPYWALGIVWFPLVLVVGLFVTRLGRDSLRRELMVLLSVGNIFTGYLWYLDLVVIRAFSPEYVGLYLTNYALTGIVIAQNWSNAVVKDFSAGTVIGVVVGVFFGPFSAVGFGLVGGLIGAVSGYTSTR